MDERELASIIRRCRGQFARPLGVSAKQEQAAIAAGVLRFCEWPSGHYEITEAGCDLLCSLAE